MKPQDENGPGQPFDSFADFELKTYQALLEDRTILLNSEITKGVIERIVLPMNAMAQKNKKPIKLLINSPGGSVENGQIVVDAILTSRAPIITVAFGEAMSASFDIFIAGDYRVMYPNTVLMMHSGSSRFDMQTLPQINQEADLHRKYFERWSTWYASRTKVTKKEWYQLLATGLNYYYFAEDAIKLGLAHEVIQIPKKSLKNLSKLSF